MKMRDIPISKFDFSKLLCVLSGSIEHNIYVHVSVHIGIVLFWLMKAMKSTQIAFKEGQFYTMVYI